MTLRETLAGLIAQRPAHYRAMLDRVARVLRDSALDLTLKPGDPMPAFVLPDAEGNLVFSDDLLAEGPLAVVFFRGDWCPFCKTTLTALNRVHPEIEAAGGGLVALTPDLGDYAAAAWRGLGLTFPVLSDLDNATALSFGAIFQVPDDLKAFYLELGIDLLPRHGDDSWFLPMPAAFVADRGGIIRYAYVSGDITDRAEPDDLVARVREAALDKGGAGTAD